MKIQLKQKSQINLSVVKVIQKYRGISIKIIADIKRQLEDIFEIRSSVLLIWDGDGVIV